MANKRPDVFSLEEAIAKKSFTPSVRDLNELMTFLERDEAGVRKQAALAVQQLSAQAIPALIARVLEPATHQRPEMIRLLGQLAEREPGLGAEVYEALSRLTSDEEVKVRRYAVLALGRFPGEPSESLLFELWAESKRPEERRAIVESLGKVGGARSATLIAAIDTGEDPELAKRVSQALLILKRESSTESFINAKARLAHPIEVHLHCRNGLEQIVKAECPSSWQPRIVGTGRVAVVLSGALEELFAVRTMISFGFLLKTKATDPKEAALEALTSERAAAIFKAFTSGEVRYRLEFKGKQWGKKRAVLWECAELVQRAKPALVNAPRGATWELVVRQAGRGVDVELLPKALEDPRFAYRDLSVDAASHPSIAAAIVRVGGVTAADVVWDPFAGSGTELIERALAGPYKELHATDLSPEARQACLTNAAAAGVEHLTYTIGDARSVHPQHVTLVITNPPMGRRLASKDLESMLLEVLSLSYRILAPRGRFVWLSAFPKRTWDQARTLGFEPMARVQIDLGGFAAELQAFVRP